MNSPNSPHGTVALSPSQFAPATPPQPIRHAAEKIGLRSEEYDLYGSFKAKLTPTALKRLAQPRQGNGKLILVTAMSPTPAGEGKTTLAIGLGDALNRLGEKTTVCLREPSLGPTFGMKGGATGGGRAQIVPQDEINLHFTGDFHAIAAAHNLLAALIDNHIYHGNQLDFDVRRIAWKRVMDMNDRALREIVVGLGGSGNGYPRESGFDIVVASEVMAALCLSESMADLRRRLSSMVVGYSRDKKPIRAEALGGVGAMLVLLKDAFRPNLVQTLEGNPVLVHGGPFANIAHGCNSVVATKMALSLGGHVVTEAGFGADLGAEKFINIKCRSSGLRPDAAVLVATLRAIKFHGVDSIPKDLGELRKPNLSALKAGMANLERHYQNLTEQFKLPTVVAINAFEGDDPEEMSFLTNSLAKMGAKAFAARHWKEGGAGAETLAKEVLALAKGSTSSVRLLYADNIPLVEKIRTIATRLYGAADVFFPAQVSEQLESLQKDYGHFPVCIAKIQSSFSSQASLRGAPSNHRLDVREVRLAAGAGFLVVVCGEILTMPGLPKVPAAFSMDLSPEDGAP